VAWGEISAATASVNAHAVKESHAEEFPRNWKNVPCRAVLPTSPISAVRIHLCPDTARSYGGVCCPRKYGINGTIPATVNSSDGSGDTNDAEGTTVWFFCSKNVFQRRAIS